MNVPLDSLLEILDNGAGRGLRSVPVLMPVALDQTYDYLVPEGIERSAGRLRARAVRTADPHRHRLGRRRVGDGKPVDPKKLKPLTSRIDAPQLPEISMRFAEWVARYSLAPLGMVARMMMSADAAFEPPKHRFGVCARRRCAASRRK